MQFFTATSVKNNYNFLTILLQQKLVRIAIFLQSIFRVIRGRGVKESVTETVDSRSIPDRVKPKDYRNRYVKLPCLTISIK